MLLLLGASCRCRTLVNRIANPIFFKRENYGIFKSIIINNRKSSSSVLDVNTNVVKDVLLYSNADSVKHIRLLNAFALGQFVFWNFLAENIFSTLRNTPVDDTKIDGPWYTKINLGSDVMRYSLTAMCLILGNGLLAIAYFYTIRAVKFIVLRKGGQAISIVTNSPIGNDRIVTVPIKEISANESRATARVTIPIKVKGKSFYYLLDMKGKFGNMRLFDATVGLRRNIATNK